MTSSVLLEERPEQGTDRIGLRAFSRLLCDLRRTIGISQEELSGRSGLSVRTIRNLETGRTERPRKRTCELLASALELSGGEAGRLMAAAGWADGVWQPPALTYPQRPSELPAATSILVGRGHVLAEVRRRLASDLTAPNSGRLVMVTGPPGSGKTAVVLHAAYQLRERFPDGQVFVDLDGSHDAPLVGDVTARLLRALGVDRWPRSAEERAAMLRAVLADRRVLLVVDNVDSEAQIRPLLPCLSGSAVLVASRCKLWALPGGHTIELGALSLQESVLLLARLAGRERTQAEPAAVHSIVRSCEGLPLALHIAGWWIAARPHRKLGDLADRLADENLRMRYLRIGDLSVASSVEAGFRKLPETARHALHRLGSLRGAFDVQEAARVLEMTTVAAADVVDDLVHWQMLRMTSPTVGGIHRYRLHDSVRLYVSRLLGCEDGRPRGGERPHGPQANDRVQKPAVQQCAAFGETLGRRHF